LSRILASLFLVVALLVASVPAVGAADQPIRLYVDGQELTTDVPPMIIDGRTMVPVRVVADHLGFSVEWWEATRTVYLRGRRTVQLRLGSPDAYVDGRAVKLDVPAQAVQGRTLVPLRFIAEALGYDVAWDGQARAVRLTAPRVLIENLNIRRDFEGLVQITADRNEQDMTVIRGTVDPQLGWKTVALRVRAFGQDSQRRVPVTGGSFAVTAAVQGGEKVPVWLYADDDGSPFASFVVINPEGIRPRLLSEHGVEVIDVWTTELADRLSAAITPEGMLRLEGALAEPPEKVWLTGTSQSTIQLTLDGGRFETVVPLKGPERYRICIQPGNRIAGCVIAEQTRESTLEPISLWGGQLRFEEPLASGMTVGESMRVAGQAKGLGYPMLLFEVKKKGTEEKLVWLGGVPVRDGRFDGRIWFPFGPGEYEVSVWAPRDRSYRIETGRWSVTSTVEEELRWRVPSRGVESDAPEIIALAEEITRGLTTPVEKARAIHDWVARNVAYDVEKARTRAFAWGDGALKTLDTRTGVCQDYAYLTAALLRAVGIKARVAIGMGKSGFFWIDHAWTEAWVGDRWLVMDTTWDAGYLDGDQFHWRFSTQYFDPDPETFTLDHSLQSYEE